MARPRASSEGGGPRIEQLELQGKRGVPGHKEAGVKGKRRKQAAMQREQETKGPTKELSHRLHSDSKRSCPWC